MFFDKESCFALNFFYWFSYTFFQMECKYDFHIGHYSNTLCQKLKLQLLVFISNKPTKNPKFHSCTNPIILFIKVGPILQQSNLGHHSNLEKCQNIEMDCEVYLTGHIYCNLFCRIKTKHEPSYLM